MRSMTGYGRAVATVGGLQVTVQVSSVNRKGLEVTLALPDEWGPLEPGVGEAVRRVASRGKVHVAVEYERPAGDAAETWDEDVAERQVRRLETWARQRGVAFTPTPELLWSVLSSSRRPAGLPAVDVAGPVVMGALDDALKAFAAMRQTEGAALLVDFLSRLGALRRNLAWVVDRAPAVAPQYREQLLQRLRQAGLSLDVADERVLKEVALFADRCDVTEELTRLGSHLEQLETLLRSDGEIGRKAEFILQEIGREVHTIGSKANDLSISRAVIELKNELERVREQIANVE
jgi:uncharacterized protein (TIGR00255 family)